MRQGGMSELQALLAAARRLEDQGRHAAALEAYQAAFAQSGQDPALAADLGRLALRMGEPVVAEQLLRLHVAASPQSIDGLIALAHALREQQRYPEALDLLAPAVQANPRHARLWSALGAVLVQQGRPHEALPFLDEAVRLDHRSGAALYARGNALADLGEHSRAIADYEAAIARLSKADRERVRVPLALSRLGAGDLGRGWDDYRARFSSYSAKPVRFEIDAEPWPFDADEPADALVGRSLILVGEQGLGDEVMFANIVPDLLRSLGQGGRLVLAVEERLVPLFARAFPQAEVVAHETDAGAEGVMIRRAPAKADFWAPMGAPLRRLRRKAEDFPQDPYLRPDPARVAHWRSVLAVWSGPKIGLLWKSLKLDGERQRQFAPFARWAPVLATPGVTFVNLQYGECADELAHAKATLGVEVVQPPGLDLKQDLDGVAALCAALDLTVGPSNAAFNLAGAIGAPLWLIAPRGAWTMLGTKTYPWYPRARCFETNAVDGWAATMTAVADALAERLAERV